MVIYPSRLGWAVAPTTGGEVRDFATMDEASIAIPPGTRLTVALRTSRVLVERFTLPSTDSAEIEAMASLQLEKSLPYALEETATEIGVLRQGETSSVAVALVVKTTAIEEEFAPLTARGIWPDELILFPVAVPSLSPASGAVMSVFAEGPEVVFVVSEDGKLAFAQTVSSNEFTLWDSEIAQLMFSAEISGLRVQDALVRLETGLDHLVAPLSLAFGRSPERFEIRPPFRCPLSKLAPASWSAAKQARRRGSQVRRQLAIAAGVYVAIILAIVAFLVVLRLRVDQMEKQVKQVLPETELIARSSARWEALAPALDYQRQTLEVLLQLYKSRPSDDVLITSFDQTTTDMVVRGEAPAIDQALLFLDTLKSKKELPYTLSNEQPQPVGDNKFQFQVTGGGL